MSSEAVVAPRVRGESLNDVRAVIPASCYTRSRSRATSTLVQAALVYLGPTVSLALTDRWWALIVLWMFAGLGVAGLFVLGHDASHGALVDSRRMNRLLARVCMAPSAHVEAAWDLGHNRIHHGYTTREGFDFVWHPTSVAEYRGLGRLYRLRHRVEWSWMGAGAYFLRAVWWEKMWRYNAPGKRHAAIVRDKIVLGAVLALILVTTAVLSGFGGGWLATLWVPVKLFVVPFLVFVQIIGWTVYVHHVSPEIRWWGRREWSQFNGQMESTTIVHVPRLVNRLWLHNIFIHVPHHVDSRIRFDHLPRAAAAITAGYPHAVRSSRLSIVAYVRTTRACKLYDFDEGHWLGYGAAASSPC